MGILNKIASRIFDFEIRKERSYSNMAKALFESNSEIKRLRGIIEGLELWHEKAMMRAAQNRELATFWKRKCDGNS